MVVIGKAQVMTVVESGNERLLSFHAKVSWSINHLDMVACVAGSVSYDVPPTLVRALRMRAS